MTRQPRLVALLAALCSPLVGFAQNTVFNDSFTADALNPATYPTPTSTSTGWIMMSNKAAPTPVESGSALTINMAGTSAGYVETQALFSASPVQLLPGTYIELTATFVPTYVLTNTSDNIVIGLFNSGGTAPLSGMINSQLSNALTNFATGGAKGWLGYNANAVFTGGSNRMLTRPAQTGTNNTVQDVLLDGQSSSVGYTTPSAANFSTSGSLATTFTNGNTYTMDYKLALNAAGTTLTATCAVYNGTGTTGTGGNTLVGSWSGTVTGSNLLTKAFDALAIGWRADAGTSSPSNIRLTALTVKTTGGAPWFTTQPPNTLMASIGSSMNLYTVTGGTVSSYQWQVSTDGGATFTNIDSGANPSAATASLTINNVQYTDAGIYRLIATNAAGSTTSSSCTVTVTANPVPPSISVQPVGGTVTGGMPFTFSVIANGTSPLAYQWQKSTDGVTYTTISGATNSSYTIASTSILDEGSYEVTVTNGAGSATSSAAQLTVNQPVTILTQPVGATLNAGDNFTLSVTAVGKPAPTYQWYLNGVAIGGATNATYSITGASGANAGIYTVVATNTTGDTATSSGAAVAVLSSTLTATATTPSSSAINVLPDTRLSITFNQPISIGLSGQIRIYDTTNSGTPVDTIDIVAGNALMQTLRAGGATSTAALPVQTKTVGGLTNFHYYPITVSGNMATIYPRNGVLSYNRSYYVVIDPGVFNDATGLSYAGIATNTGWTFGTKTIGPATTATRLVVAADGSGDFYTVQAALDLIPSGNTTPRTLFIKKGTYFEEVYFASKHSITFLGEDRQQSVVVYPNNNNFNNVSGSYHRMVFQADHANNVAVVNLTVRNSTAKGGSQAEALILNGTTSAQAVVTDVDLVSLQDTLLINGQAYVANSHITGDVDFMWGNGPAFFRNCQLTIVNPGYFTQIRNGTGNHGYVFVNCRFNAPAALAGTYLGRIDPSSNNFPYSEMVVLDSTFGDATNNAFLNVTTGVSGSNYQAGWWLLNNAASAAAAPNVHNWTNNIIDGTGAAVTDPNGDTFTNMPTDATTQANYRNATWVLNTKLDGTSFGSWTPAMAPIIAVQPAAQTINSGAGFTLSVTAFGVPTVTYQWLLNGSPISGATGASYTVANAGGTNAGNYSVVVTSGSSSVTSASVPLVVHGGPPVIELQPANTTALLGTTATLNVWALGDAPITYQWSKDGTPISGATNQSLRLTGLQLSDAGGYSVAVTSNGSTVVSTAAALTIDTPAAPVPPLPVIPAGTFDVTAYGAVGDGVTDNTAAIQAAINAARTAGGGTIEIPAAAAPYLCGPITLYSSMNFQVDGGATLQALPYLTYPRSTTAPAHFITINSGSTDVEFSGDGVIDGNGAAWWAAYNAGSISNRPRLVQITKLTRGLFTGLTFLNSPNFHLAFSGVNTNVTLYGVTISAPGDSPNTDGMDVAGQNFLIQNCSVSDGDDNIVAKPGSAFCSNLVIAKCAIGTGHGVSIGGQTNVGLDGMLVTDCTFNGTSTALRFKADPTQGGPVQNVTFQNLTMTNVQYPILFYSYYNQLGSPGATSGSSQITPAKVNAWNVTPPNSLASSTLPTWKNIVVRNLTVTNGSGYSTIWGLPLANALVQNVVLENVNIQGGAGLELYDATNIQLKGTNNVGSVITCNALAITGQPAGNTINVGDSVTFSVTAVGGSGTNNTGLTYQWNLNGTPLTDGLQADGSTVTGALTSSLTVTNTRVTSAGAYTATVATTLDGYNTTSNALVANSLPVSATSNAAALVVNPLPASISLSNLIQTYDGTAKAPTVTTAPTGLAYQLAYAGGLTPVNAGNYTVTATITDPNYAATPATGTLTIQPASATVTLSNLVFTYDGTPKTPTVTTDPANLPVTLTYNGDATAPTTVASYTVVATVTDPNYVGAKSDTLVINKATPVITWDHPGAISYGTALTATQLNATANVPGIFAYTPPAGTVLNVGANQPLSVVFTPTDSVDYESATASTAITVRKAIALVTLANLTQPYDGMPKAVQVTTLPGDLKVVLDYAGAPNGPVFPGQYTVTATVDDPSYAGTSTATLAITVTALVRHAPQVSGGVDGSVQVLTGENITLAGSAWISDDLLVPGTPTLNLNGMPTLAGTTDEGGAVDPSDYTVTLSGKAVLRYLVRRIDPLPMPVVAPPPAPLGTRNVVLTSTTQTPGDFTTLRNLTVAGNAGMVAVPPGTYGVFNAMGNSGFVLGVPNSTEPAVYYLQNLGVNVLPGNAQLQIVGPVVIVLANGTIINGLAGAADHPTWLSLRIANGGLTISGNSVFHGEVIAPNGTVTLNGNATLDGTVTSDRLTINGTSVLKDSGL